MFSRLLTALQPFSDPKVNGAFRHLLTSMGPVLAINGFGSESEWQLYLGLVMAVLGFVGSWTANEKKNLK